MTAWELRPVGNGPLRRVRVFAGVDADHLELTGNLFLRAAQLDDLRARLTAAGGTDLPPADGAELCLSAAPASAPAADLPVGADVTPKRYPCARCGELLDIPGPTHHTCDPKVVKQGGES